MPVEGANQKSYHPKSFWYEPWGKSGVHKGVDIFAKEGTPVLAATTGIVLYTGEIGMGGNIVVVLGTHWCLHYYAHLQKITTKPFHFLAWAEPIGTVGTTGNAKGKPPHLHFTIVSIFPYFWKVDASTQGWKKMFYLNPIELLPVN